MRIRDVLVRRLLPTDAFEAAVATYEGLFAQAARLRFDYAETGLHIAQVGQVLLIGGDDAALEPFRATAMTFLVDDLDAYRDDLPSSGAALLRDVRRVPSGRNMLIRHADGAIVEYVEHDDPDPADDVLSRSS